MDILEIRNFSQDKYLNEIGMSIDEKQMVTVQARFIAPPEIKYKSGKDGQSDIVERISIGKYEFLEKNFWGNFIFIL